MQLNKANLCARVKRFHYLTTSSADPRQGQRQPGQATEHAAGPCPLQEAHAGFLEGGPCEGVDRGVV